MNNAALAEGADLSVHLDKSLNGAAIELAHQIDGPDLIPTLTWREKRPPAVWLAWWCPQPESEAGLRALARLGERTLELAAKLPSNVGGLVSAQGEYSRGMFDTAYDRIANLQGTRRTSGACSCRRGSATSASSSRPRRIRLPIRPRTPRRWSGSLCRC